MTQKKKTEPKTTAAEKPKPEKKEKASPLAGLIEGVSAEVTKVGDYVNGTVKKMDAVKASVAYVRIKELTDALADVASRMSKIRNDLATEILPQKFDTEGVGSINLKELGLQVTISEILRVSIPPKNKEDAYQWLKDNGLEDLISDTVNSSTLAATIRSLLAENKEVPEDIFNLALMKNTSVTKLKSKK